MKILYLIDNFSLGGAQTIVKGLMENSTISSQRFAIALRCKNPEMSIDHPHVISFQSKSKYSFKVVRFLKDFIAEKNIEILHCQLPRSIIVGYLLKRFFPEVAYIIHEQGDVFESWAYAILLRRMKRKADAIIACSKATAEVLTTRSRIDPEKIHILYNFVDLKRFHASHPFSFKGQNIAFAGRIEKRKGWREFIKVAPHFKGKNGLSFYMAGTGTEVKKLDRRLRKIDDSNIKYLGFVKDMRTYYQQMDILVIPSHFEPMGMVAVEAMACGIPVLAANVPGLNEIVKHEENGWTYTPRSVTELIKALEGILDCSPGKIEMIIKQGMKHAGSFSLQVFSGKLNNIYHSISQGS
jgi:glycosyltransferase involved in cell wall biosynthesis